MPSLAKCLSLGAFAPEDAAEIHGFIAANSGDAAAGVQAYLGTLDGDLQELTDQVARQVDPALRLVGKTAEDLINLPELVAATERMMSIVPTDAADNFGTVEYFNDRTYNGPDGEQLSAVEAIDAMLSIASQWTGGEARKERRATILMGAPAAGKSTIAEEQIAPGMGALIVDNDEFKKMVPEYDGGIGANAVHEESKVLGQSFLNQVTDEGYNVVIPKVGGNPEATAKQVAELKAKGYTVDIAYMEVDRDEAMRRMVSRFFSTGRLIPPAYLMSQMVKIGPSFAALKTRGVADGYIKYNNNVPFGQQAAVTEDTRADGRRADTERGTGSEGSGRTLSQSQAREVGPGTPEFDLWFGDSAVVDDGGQPLVVYHGTHVSSIEAFEPGRASAIYFTPRRAHAAEGYGPNVTSAYLSVQKIGDLTDPDSDAYKLAVSTFNENGGWSANPDAMEGRESADFDPAQDETWEIFDNPDTDIGGALMAAGYDGLKLGEFGGDVSYAVFEPTQIKSVDNRGNFDPSDPRILNQSAASLQSSPMDIDGTGPGGRVLNRDLGAAFNERHVAKYGGPLDPAIPADYAVIEKAMAKDYAEQTAQPDNGESWYAEDIAEAIRTTTEIIPELADPTHRDMFLTMVALLSPQQKPKQNWENAVLAMQGYVRDGTIPLTKPSGKNYGVNSHRTGLQLLQYLIAEKGLDGALAWVQSPITGSEMAEVRRASGLFTTKPKLGGYLPSETSLGETKLGIYMMGPKVGDFMQNSVGIDQDAVTVDLWMARTYNRLIGRLTDVPPKVAEAGGLADQVRGRAERDVIKRLVRGAAKAASIPASSMQAALWYFEQRLYRAHKIRSDSQNFSDAAHAAVSSRRDAGAKIQDTGRGAQGDPAVDGGRDDTGGNTRGGTRDGANVRQPGGSGAGVVQTDPAGFLAASTAALSKMGPIAAQVGTDPGDQQFLLDDGKSGYALDGTNIISVFSSPDSPPGVARRVLTDAVSRGGDRLDGFNTFLPDIYAKHGFKAVARLPFNREFAPDGWDYDYFNDAYGTPEPDVMFMVYDPASSSAETDNHVADYDAGVEAQDEALSQRILHQKKNDSPRGQISIPAKGIGSGTSVISLFEDADLSTFLHESAHYFLEVVNNLGGDSNAPRGLADDLASIRKFVGAKGDGEFTTEQHEKFARAFEAYLMEGNAPSLELSDAFATFRSWLINIYRSVTGLNVNINDDLRGVFDRMLATDEAIETARAEQAMSALFSAKPPSMPQTDWDVYQRTARRGEEQASQNLLKKTMAKIARETKSWFKAERDVVRDRIEEQFNAKPEYQLIEALANRRSMADPDMEVPDMRIDRTILAEEFGDDVLAELDRSHLGGKRAIFGPDGSTPGEVAEFFGFKTAMEMVDTLRGAGKRKQMIDAEADRVMDQRHGDPLNDGTIEDEAMRTIHSEQQAATVVAEARELTRQLGQDPTGMTSRLYRARAIEMISRMTVAQATKSQQFLAAERRASRDASAAFAKVMRGGGEPALTEALRSKERQVLNQHLYTASRQLAEEVAKGRDRMMKYRKSSVREKLEGSYIEQIDALLEAYDFRKRGPGELQKVSNLKKYMEEMIEAGREAELNIDQRLIDDTERRHYTKLTAEELRGLFDTIANIDHMGRFKQKLIERARKRDLQASADRVVAAVRSSQKPRRETKTPRRGQQALNLLSKPDTMMIRMDGGAEFGPVWEELKRSVDEGSALEQEMHAKMAVDVDTLYSKHYTHKQLRSMLKPISLPDVTFPWTKQEIIALALNMGNKDNFQRAMDQNVSERRTLDPTALNSLLGQLDKNDWQFVQGTWDMINSYWPELAEVQKRRTGTIPKKVEAQMMFDDAPGFVKGGYYPIKFDPSESQASGRDEESATDKYMTAGHSSTTMVGNGMTKQREATGGGRALLYDLQVGFAHMRETIRFIALSEAIDASYRVLNHRDVEAAMRETGNTDTQKTLNLWLQDTAQGPVFNTDIANFLARAVKNNFTLSRLAFNLKTVILQATGLSQSAAVIGKRNMVRGMALYWRRPAASIADTLAVSPKMRERQSTFQKDIYDFTNEMEASSQFGSRYRKGKSLVAKAGFWPIVAMQFYIVDMPTWMGAYAKYIDEYGGDQKRAALAADKMVERAQDTGVLADRSAVERGTLSKTTRQADIVRVFTTLGGYMLTKANRGYVRGLQGRADVKAVDGSLGKLAAASNAALDLLILFSFEAVMMGLMWELLDDDDDIDDLNKFLLKETGSAMVGGIPLLRDAAGAFNGYGGGGVYGSVTEVPANFYVQALQGENDGALRRSVADIVGITTGLPTTASMRLIEGLLDEDAPMADALLGRNPLNR